MIVISQYNTRNTRTWDMAETAASFFFMVLLVGSFLLLMCL
jgi:hypothetical protein